MRVYKLSLIILVFVIACIGNQTNKKIVIEYFSKTDLSITVNKIPIVNNETCVLIYLKKRLGKIKQAYCGCITDNIKTIDMKNNIIVGCRDKLYISKDTVWVCITPTKTGKCEIPNITLLYSDENGNYHITDTTNFSFIVNDSIR